MKILALDLGDVYTGVAISDSENIIAKPYKTIDSKELNSFIKEIINKENINFIVIGYPKTMQGKISIQTQKVIDLKSDLEKRFPNVSWIFWDERLTSKNAEKLKKNKQKEDKIKLHSIAAALILQSYLEFLRIKKTF